MVVRHISFFFFFQAEDGIRDYKVTGVQTCALPICIAASAAGSSSRCATGASRACAAIPRTRRAARSEEHTSELQSPCNLVCRLLLEKKKKPQLTSLSCAKTRCCSPGATL